MDTIQRIPDTAVIKTTDNKICAGASLRFCSGENGLSVYLSSPVQPPAKIELRWQNRITQKVSVMCDAWERAYAELSWRGIEESRVMPWYFFINSENITAAYGVKVRPSAFVHFRLDSEGITAVCDVRNGIDGVVLGDRELHVADFVSKIYTDIPAFNAAAEFCRVMCTDPILPDKPVYGGNNWYYAYGKSSFKDIVSDTVLQARLAKGFENRPFMTIDDGWQPNRCTGPWVANKAFGDMKKTAEAIKELDVRPGIWIRYLSNETLTASDGATLPDGGLDPSNPAVLESVVQKTQEIVCDWGYELIKHDFSTFDIFRKWGRSMGAALTEKELHFYDRSLTTAEIIVQFYRTIHKAAGSAYIIGCNCVSHLCAGLVHINRTGDDTSGADWARTRSYGVNTLAFRLCQNKSFYMADADCVGIIPGKIDWELNLRWATLLANSGSPFFISCADGSLSAEQEAIFRSLYEKAAVQNSVLVPEDWMYNNIPAHYTVDGEKMSFNWYSV